MTPDIARLRSLMEKATPGETSPRDLLMTLIPMPDRQYLAAVSNAMPALLDRMERLEAVAKHANEVAKNYCNTSIFIGGMAAMTEALARLDGAR